MNQAIDFAGRRDRARAALARLAEGRDGNGAEGPAPEGLLVTNLLNVRYLTGFTGSNAAVLIGADPDRDAIATDGRYRTQVAEQVPDLPAVITRALLTELAATVPDVALGFEADQLTVAEHTALVEELAPRPLVPTTGITAALREVKDAAELDLLRRACAISDQGLAALVGAKLIRPGLTEKTVARALESFMLDRGADGIAFETIVAAGANSAIPHHRPTDAVLATGDFVKIDFGAQFAGYHADITRTFVLGEPADWQVEIYELVRAAQEAGVAAVQPGARAVDVDAAARTVIANAGYGEQFAHGLGHGVGLEIHEAPSIGALATGTLLAGAAVTVEPGIYLPGRGGVRIEDSVIVGPAGPRDSAGPEIMTTSPKNLIVL